MEKDKLEDFISRHRHNFDDQEPPDYLWDKIDQAITKKHTNKITFLSLAWKIAAAVIIFIASYFFHYYTSNNKVNNSMAIKTNRYIYIKSKPVIIKQIEYKDTTTYKPIAKTSENSPEKNVVPVKNNYPKEIDELRAYYVSRIEQKKHEIRVLTASNPSIENDISVDFNELDSIYKTLRNDLKDNIDNSEVISAMIQNYRIRLDILENILEQLKKSNNNEKESKQYEL